MKTEKIYIGNIRRCTSYEEHYTRTASTCIDDMCIENESLGYINSDDVLYKENAILLKLDNGGFVDLEDLNSLLDILKLKKNSLSKWITLGGSVMITTPYENDCLFVDRNSLRNYSDEVKSNVSVYKLRKNIANNGLK